PWSVLRLRSATAGMGRTVTVDVEERPHDLPAPDEWGPTVRGGGRRLRRVVWPTLLVLVLLAVVVYGGAGLYGSSQITRSEVGGLQTGSGPLNVLVVGSDSREGLTGEQRRELTTGSAPGERTDTIFIMSVSGGRAALLAFPRDLWVTLCDGSTGRINAATAKGGSSCLVQTVSNVSGIPIDNFLVVHFLGFRDIVDAVDGVEVCLDEPIADQKAGIDLPAGCQILGGKEALGYVRTRSIDNDLERIKRQQQFLRSLASRILSPATLANPLRLYRTAGEVGGALSADQGLGVVDLGRLGLGMRGLASGRGATHTVPADPATIGGAAVLQIRENEAAALFAAFKSGAVLAEQAGEVAPEDVTVSVLNGAGASGLAGQVAEHLRSRGFQIATVGNAEAVVATVVLHPPGKKAEAELVSRELGGREVREDGSVDNVTVLLGQDAADLGA
ncbi:MAG: LCP family protein, partial [Nitriliruptorales bacterium]